MTIHRQHSETEVNELYGQTCSKIIAVANKDEKTNVSLIYLQVERIWHRLYLDAGLLFWDEGISPDAEEDLLDDEDYVDLGIEFSFKNKKFSLIEMKDRVLTIRFDNGAKLQMTEKEDESYIKVFSK